MRLQGLVKLVWRDGPREVTQSDWALTVLRTIGEGAWAWTNELWSGHKPLQSRCYRYDLAPTTERLRANSGYLELLDLLSFAFFDKASTKAATVSALLEDDTLLSDQVPVFVFLSLVSEQVLIVFQKLVL